ncbi:filamin-A-like [Ctenocephalides felis]|uniref:filamin-A-like n=1 Tax=Ctenocephalides felis TaxID=7515 RepID=UPI000E6E2D35|nr:filamin-A-like [Ctenocephalides felis]
MPTTTKDTPFVEDNRDGTISVKYDPREQGTHELFIKHNDAEVPGSPFKFHVDAVTSGYITAYGTGLTQGATGKPSVFTVSTKDAGAGALSMSIEGPCRTELSCHDNKDGTVSVSYLPAAPGDYTIKIRYGDRHIQGSPFCAKVTGEPLKRSQVMQRTVSEVTLPVKPGEFDISTVNASVQSTAGLEEPCMLKLMPTGNIGVVFTPRTAGDHTVSVKRLGKHVTNSPFKIVILPHEVGDATKVLCSGPGLNQGKTHADNIFTVDTRNAGYGGLALSIEGPSKVLIQCNDQPDGTVRLSYKPTEPGYYVLNLKYADHHVTGSPFAVKVSGDGSNRQREKMQKHREPVRAADPGQPCKLTFKMSGISTFDLAATVKEQDGVAEDAEVTEEEDGVYAVNFVPQKQALYIISVKHKDIHISGSPFPYTVGPLTDSGAHLVKAGGAGLQRGEQGHPAEVNVWTREAGGGALAVAVEGPSKAVIDFKDRKDGSCHFLYTVTEPGEYRIGIKFNDQYIPDAPYNVIVYPTGGDAQKLEIAQFPKGIVPTDKPAQFIIRRNGTTKGQLDARLLAPSGKEYDCFTQLVDEEQYSVRLFPRETGIHNIMVKFNGIHIPGSPYLLKVGNEDVDPAAISASGKGLHYAKTGQKSDFLVDTCDVPAGTLWVTLDGPGRAAIDCSEVEDGYKVRYTPLVAGDYYISVKYNQYHIIGSPFKLQVEGENLAELGAQETSSVKVQTVQKISKEGKKLLPNMPVFNSDASLVTSKGIGLKKAYMGKQNQFQLNAAEAGNNILLVSVYGPKGFNEEVSIKHTGKHQYTVSYLVRERGEYILFVKWGDDHIPGSPFKVDA